MGVRRLISLISILLLSCTYFNTFYNAKTYFNAAEREYKKEGKLTPEIRQNYNKVIEKCSKILEFYPRSKYVDDAVFLTALSYKRLGERVKAEKKFKELFEFFPESKYIPMARLEYAGLLLDQERFDEALEELNRAEKMGQKRESALLKVKLFVAMGKYGEALENIKTLLNDKLKEEEKRELLLLGAEAALKKKDYEMAKYYLGMLLHSNLRPSERFKTRLLLIGILESENKLEEALQSTETQEYETASEEYRILGIKKAEILAKKGDIKGAKKVLRAITEERVRDTSIARAKLMLASLLEKEDSLEKALEIYNSLKTSRYYFIQREAMTKKNALEELLRLKDDTLNVDKFRLGEIYLFQLERPEDAYRVYQGIVNESQDKQERAKALYAMLLIARHYLNNNILADSLLNTLREHYKDTYYGREAIRKFESAEK